MHLLPGCDPVFRVSDFSLSAPCEDTVADPFSACCYSLWESPRPFLHIERGLVSLCYLKSGDYKNARTSQG